MGLARSVGYLIELKENDEDGANWFKDSLTELNRVLEREGLPPRVGCGRARTGRRASLEEVWN